MARRMNYSICPAVGKRSFETEHEAHRALGQARTRRQRHGDAVGTRRGLKVERRIYWHDECDGYHLTEESKRTFNEKAGYAA